MTEANTKHGAFTAQARTRSRYIRTLIARNRLLCAATRLWPYLPENMAARLAQGPEELATPIHPSNLPYLTKQQATRFALRIDHAAPGAPPPRTRTKPTTARTAERLAARTEATTQAPWRDAIAAARATKRAHLAAKRAARKTRPSRRNPIQRETTAHPAKTRTAPTRRNPIQRENHPQPPDAATAPTICDLSHLERELAARRACLRIRLSKTQAAYMNTTSLTGPAPAEGWGFAPNPTKGSGPWNPSGWGATPAAGSSIAVIEAKMAPHVAHRSRPIT